MADLFNEDFVEYLHLFNKYQVEYVLVGGMAVNLHGYRRSTGDMDLFVNPTKENHTKMKKVHADFGMLMGEMEIVENFIDTVKYDVYTFGVSPVQIDVMTACKGITFEEAFRNSEKFMIDKKIPINVVEYHVLLKAKKAANRTRDIADIEELQKVRNLRGKDEGASL